MALKRRSSARSIASDAARDRTLLAWALILFAAPSRSFAADPRAQDIQLELRPRICTLSAGDRECDTEVQASWRAAHNESLCLVIQGRPEVKRCWENYSEGTYTLALTFTEDLVFQLKDLDLQNVLASEVLRVVREALRYRHKRRQPWNIFD